MISDTGASDADNSTHNGDQAGGGHSDGKRVYAKVYAKGYTDN